MGQGAGKALWHSWGDLFVVSSTFVTLYYRFYRFKACLNHIVHGLPSVYFAPFPNKVWDLCAVMYAGERLLDRQQTEGFVYWRSIGVAQTRFTLRSRAQSAWHATLCLSIVPYVRASRCLIYYRYIYQLRHASAAALARTAGKVDFARGGIACPARHIAWCCLLVVLTVEFVFPDLDVSGDLEPRFK